MFCSGCGKEVQSGANFCSACGRSYGRPGGWEAFAQTGRKIVRPRYPRVIAGVCSGFALSYGWDVNLTRFMFALLTLVTFPIGVVCYVAAWLLLPDEQFTLPHGTGAPTQG